MLECKPHRRSVQKIAPEKRTDLWSIANGLTSNIWIIVMCDLIWEQMQKPVSRKPMAALQIWQYI